MRTIILILFASLVSAGAFAQYRDIKKLADKNFEEGKYFEAAYNYDLLTDSSKTVNLNIPTYLGRSESKKTILQERPFIYYRLAESHRLYQNYHAAENWYAKIISQNYDAPYPLTRLWYAVCLRANENFGASISQLQQFKANFKGDAKYKVIADRELATSTLAKQQYASASTVTVSKLNALWNSEGGNFALIKNNNTLWLTSTKYNTSAKKYLANIYKQEDGNAGTKAIIGNDGSSTEYGTPSISKAGNRMYFTVWRKDGAKTTLAIYYRVNENNIWSAITRLNKNVNADGYNSMQPRLTDDGKRLFYASNKPGGQGGLDLWVSDLDSNGNAINSVNLGSKINSSYDEEAPFYDTAKNRLIYSSKGFTGIGGFDLFESYNINNQWSAPKNLGYPANSSKDDLYYFQDPDDVHKAYLSSDRQSDCCLAVFELNEKPISIRGSIASCNSDKALQGVKISLIDADSKQVIKSDAEIINGIYDIKTYERRNYQLRMEKEGYFTKVIPISLKAGMDTLYSPQICLQEFIVKKPIALENILYDYSKADLRSESVTALNNLIDILKDNPTLKIELAAHTDSVGTTAANLNLSQRRAQACVDYLVANGIDKTRVYAKGYGESVPIVPNSLPNGADNPAGRQLNRRTEFTILGK
nr:OmpA family protein [uncultured Mucilaginibacter sp.]